MIVSINDEVIWRAIEVFGDHDRAKKWFYSPCADLDGSCPAFLSTNAATAGIVLDTLGMIETKFLGEKGNDMKCKINFSDPEEFEKAVSMEPTAEFHGNSMIFADQGFAQLWFETFVGTGYSVIKDF